MLFDLVLPLQEPGVDVRVVHPALHFRKVSDKIGMSKDGDVYSTPEGAVVDLKVVRSPELPGRVFPRASVPIK